MVPRGAGKRERNDDAKVNNKASRLHVQRRKGEAEQSTPAKDSTVFLHQHARDTMTGAACVEDGTWATWGRGG